MNWIGSDLWIHLFWIAECAFESVTGLGNRRGQTRRWQFLMTLCLRSSLLVEYPIAGFCLVQLSTLHPGKGTSYFHYPRATAPFSRGTSVVEPGILQQPNL